MSTEREPVTDDRCVVVEKATVRVSRAYKTPSMSEYVGIPGQARASRLPEASHDRRDTRVALARRLMHEACER